MKWIEALERRFERWALPNAGLYLIGLQAIGVVLLTTERASVDQLWLHGSSVIHRGEIWRLLSFLMLPESTSALFLLFAFLIFMMISRALEERWGLFKFNLYLLTGYVITVLSIFIKPGIIVTNTYFLGSVFLAFATLFPEVTFRLFLILPVKVKWLGWLTVIGYLFTLLNPLENPIAEGRKWGVYSALLTYLLFFGEDIWNRTKQRQRAKVFQNEQSIAQQETRHRCEACGVTEKNNMELSFRYCSICGKCFCADHIGMHQESEHGH